MIRTAMLAIVLLMSGAGVGISSFGVMSLLADDYQGNALPHLGFFGLPATSICLAFTIVALSTARRWPLLVSATATLLGMFAALNEPLSVEVEFFFYRLYGGTQAAALLTVLLLIAIHAPSRRPKHR